MDGFDEAMFDELDEAEGSADSWDEIDALDEAEAGDSGDEIDGLDEMEFDELDEADGLDEMDQLEADGLDGLDGFDEMDEMDDLDSYEAAESDEAAWDQAIGYALGAESSDEFFKRLAKGVAKFAKKAAPVLGKIARTVGPMAKMIPGPWGKAIGGVANVVGQLMADESSEEDALEAFAELAVNNPAAMPIAAGLAARRVLGAAAPRMSAQQRTQAVQTVRKAVNGLVARGGPTAARALVPLARSVLRTSVARRTPAAQRAKVLASTAARIASPGSSLGQQLARPLPAGRMVIRRAGAAVRAGSPPARRVVPGLGRTLAGLAGRAGSLGSFGGGGYGHRRRRRIVIDGPVTIVIRR
jgi:hypothetical protein